MPQKDKTKKNVANTRSLQHSVLLWKGTALGMKQLPLCDNPSHKTLSETPPALWCALLSRMYDHVRVCAACTLALDGLYQIFFDLYQFSSLGSGDKN